MFATKLLGATVELTGGRSVMVLSIYPGAYYGTQVTVVDPETGEMFERHSGDIKRLVALEGQSIEQKPAVKGGAADRITPSPLEQSRTELPKAQASGKVPQLAR